MTFKKIIALSSVFVLLSSSFPLQAATTQTNDEALNTIFQLLDEELAKWEQDSIYKYANNDKELETAIATIYAMGITKFNTRETFMADQAIRRDEAATMFYRFVTSKQLSTSTVNTDCDFPDLSEAHSDLIQVVKDSCKAGLFYGAYGMFLPTSPITNAQAITVMARILDGKKDESVGHRADNYYDVMARMGVMTSLAMKDKRNYGVNIVRGDIAIMLYRVNNELGG